VNEVLTVATETGKRYFCGKCGAEFVVTRGSDEGDIHCCGEPLSKK
jgi:DNA-directed RNA polymerase subunit RPC12/RpoP